VLDCNRRVLGVGDQLPGGSGLTAQSFQYVQVIGTGTDDARGRAFHERGNERERLVEGGWGVKGKQHPWSPAPVPEPDLVILCVERPRPVEIDARAGMDPAHGHQPERRRLRRLATLQSVIQRFGNKGADA
jgi:hypothetical protein